MFGSEYVIEHCVSVFKAQYKAELFKMYITDCLMAMLKGRGAKVKRFYDMLHPPKEDKRSPQEVVDDIASRAGIRVVKSRGSTVPDGSNGD